MVGHPGMFSFGAKVSEIYRMIGDAANTDDLSVFHGNIEAATVGTQDTGRMYPGIRFALDAEININS